MHASPRSSFRPSESFLSQNTVAYLKRLTGDESLDWGSHGDWAKSFKTQDTPVTYGHSRSHGSQLETLKTLNVIYEMYVVPRPRGATPATL